MFYKVKSVKALSALKLLVHFQNGEVRQYDVAPLLNEWEHFKNLETVIGLFEQVKVDIGGYGVSWNDELDLSCNELYINGVLIKNQDKYTA